MGRGASSKQSPVSAPLTAQSGASGLRARSPYDPRMNRRPAVALHDERFDNVLGARRGGTAPNRLAHRFRDDENREHAIRDRLRVLEAIAAQESEVCFAHHDGCKRAPRKLVTACEEATTTLRGLVSGRAGMTSASQPSALSETEGLERIDALEREFARLAEVLAAVANTKSIFASRRQYLSEQPNRYRELAAGEVPAYYLQHPDNRYMYKTYKRILAEKDAEQPNA